MKIENQVTNLELSKKLKELRVKQESLWIWMQCEEENEFDICLKEDGMKIRKFDGIREDTEKLHKIYSAFTVAELTELLPHFVNIHRNISMTWVITNNETNNKWGTSDDYLADALAEFIIKTYEK